MSKQPKKPTTRNWLRRGLSGILSLALILALLPGTVLPVRAATHWAMPYAEKLVEWGVMRGDNGNLALDRAITRAEFVTMMNRAYGYKRLGEMPFPDVSTRDWYYEDINIAYNMGYFKGASGYALPKANLTREMAAVLLTRNMMLQENVGAGVQFSDSRSLSEWSRGLVGAAADMGIISGYSDGSFKPQQNITRGEVASMLVKAIGTMVNTPGEHTLGDVYGNVTVNTSGVTLKNGTIAGNLYLTGGIDLGDVLLENVNVLGEIIVSGGGASNSAQSSIVLRNVTADAMTLDSITDQFVTLHAEGITDIGTTTVRTNAYVDDSSLAGYGGLGLIVQDGGSLLQLAGNIKEVWNKTPNSELQVVQGSANKITMDEHATNSTLLVDGDARVEDLNLDVATTVTGEGDIKNLNVWAAGSTVEQLPDDITIRPGITSDINGSEMNSSQAAESSADPRLLAGYPKVKNIAPNSADLVFSTNKAGTVYWAVTALSDGSVSEDNLIEPPVYGGNILKSGSITMTAANTEVMATPSLTGLTQDGSYYVSTVFVDNRGIHSPVKVTAFTTPDGTKPAFSDGPRMSRITTEVAQVTGMPNKSCLLYYALLPKGATAPTAAELKANAVTGNLGYGTRDVVKNTNISINVNSRTLDQETDYVVYLWLTDYDGSQSSSVYSVVFKTPDERPPVITRTRAGAADETAIEMNVTVDEASTVYWVIIPEGSENEAAYEERDVDGEFDPEDNSLQIKIENGAGSFTKNGKKAIAAANANKEVLIGLSETRTLDSSKTGTSSYIMYMVAKDASGNYSKIEKIKVQTKDDTPPQLLRQEFDPTVTDGSGNPRADCDIKLVFSENIRGGTGDSNIFLTLYEAVQKAVRQNDVDAEVTARNNLGAALNTYITLYNGQSGRNDGVALANYRCEAVVDEGTQEKYIVNSYTSEDPWVINYCYATVAFANGTLTITFPTVKDDAGNILETSALRLASGATYHFILNSIRDTAVEANLLVAGGPVTEVSNMMQVQYFTTKFGTVKMDWKDEMDLGTSYKDSSGTHQFAASTTNNPARIDYHFSVEPETVQGMGEDWLSDILIASDTPMTFTLYTRDVGDDIWTLVGSTNLSVPAGTRWAYKSVAWWFPTQQSQLTASAFTPVREMTEKEYAIHVDTLNGNSTFEDWSGPITMMAYVMAGKTSQLTTQSAARSGTASEYESWVARSTDIQAIGYDVDHTAVDHLEMENPFPYQKAPKIRTENEYPFVDVYDTSANISLNLDSTGRVYWMLIPLTGLSGTLSDYTGTLTEDKVSTITSYTPASIKKIVTDTTTLPLGQVPIMHGDSAWDSISATNSSDVRLQELRVASPTQTQITREDLVPWSNVQYGTAVTASGNQLLTTRDQGFINLTGLTANTVYVLCMITQNEIGVYADTAYCYRFTTSPVSRPYFVLSGSGATINAETDTGRTSNMYFFVAQNNGVAVGSQFLAEFSTVAEANWTNASTTVNSGGNSDGYFFTPPTGVTVTDMTVLQAMMTDCYQRDGNTNKMVGSVFDVFVRETSRTSFANAIKSQTSTGDTIVWSTTTTPYAISGATNLFDCEKRIGPGSRTSDPGGTMNPQFTYVMVAMAESTDGTSSQASFRAWSPLQVVDTTPPYVQERGWLSYTTSANGDLTGGSFYLQFSEQLYAYKDGNRYPLDNCKLASQTHGTPSKAGDWVSVAQLISQGQAAGSPLKVVAEQDYTTHPASSTSAESLSEIVFSVNTSMPGSATGRTYSLTLNAYTLADMSGNSNGNGFLVIYVTVYSDGRDPVITTSWD